MVAVSLWQHQREEKVKYDLAVVHGVSGNVCHKPVPEFSQGSAQKHHCESTQREHAPKETGAGVLDEPDSAKPA